MFPLLLTLLLLICLLWMAAREDYVSTKFVCGVVATSFVRFCRRALDIRIAYLLAANLIPPYYIVCLYRSSVLIEDIDKGKLYDAMYDAM